MPKNIFRLSVSNILLKRKLFGSNFKIKFNGKKSSKCIFVDEYVERDWRLLKSKSGCKTDGLFLKYLLHLAEEQLFNRSEKISNDLSKNLPKHGKLSILHDNHSNQCCCKCHTQRMEKEKKISTEKFDEDSKKDSMEKNEVVEKYNFGGVDLQTSTKKSQKRLSENIKTESNKNLALASKYIEISSKDSNPSLTKCDINETCASGRKKSKTSRLCDKVVDLTCKENRVKDSKKTKSKKGTKVKKLRTNVENLWNAKNYHLKEKEKSKGTKDKLVEENLQPNNSCLICNNEHTGECHLTDDTKQGFQAGSTTNNNTDFTSNSLPDNLDNLNDASIESDSCGFENFEKNERGKDNPQVYKKDSDFKDLNSSLHYKSKIKGDYISFAESSLPNYLFLKTVNVDHGLSVFTKILIKKSTEFGPLLGQKMKEMDISDDANMRDIWEVHLPEGVSYMSTQDMETSNWLRFLRPGDSKATANLLTVVRDKNLYFNTVKDIQVGDELVYWIEEYDSLWSKKKLDKRNCGGCNIQFAHTLYYRKHCMIFHDPNSSLTTRKYYCKICGVAVLGKEKIMKHAADMHQGKGAYQCQFCNKFFLRLNYLEMHRTYGCSKNPQRSRPLCDLCGKKFCQPQKLKVHIKRMHSDMAEVLKDFQCKNCDKILGSRAALQRHFKEVHNKDVIGACTCDRCGKIFQNKSNLKIHMLTHSGVKPFKCQEIDCYAAFTTKQCLQFHYKRIHGFTEIPKIERSVAYTFDAYSGGVGSISDTESSCLENAKEIVHHKNGEEKTIFGNAVPEESGIRFGEKYVREKELTGKELLQDEENSRSDYRKITSSNEFHSQYNQKDKLVDDTENKMEVNSVGEFKYRPFLSNSLANTTAITPDSEEKLIRKCQEVDKSLNIANSDAVLGNPSEAYFLHQYDINSSDSINQPSDNKTLCDTSTNFQELESKKEILPRDRTNYNDIFRFNTFLRSSGSPSPETNRECNTGTPSQDRDDVSIAEDVQNSRNSSLIEICKEGETFYDSYRGLEMSRFDKVELYRSSEFDLRSFSSDKIDCRNMDLSNECRNLERRNSPSDLQRRGEGFVLHTNGERILEDEEEVEVQNLCLKEKCYQDNIEEFTKIGRENSGFDSVFIGNGNSTSDPNFGMSTFRSSNSIPSHRAYHPTAFDSESVDLTIPRPPFSSSPTYTLDLTPSRADISTRHLDFRSQLGLPSLRFGSASTPTISSDCVQISPTNYGIYQFSYGGTGHGPCQTQFQPFTPLYY